MDSCFRMTYVAEYFHLSLQTQHDVRRMYAVHLNLQINIDMQHSITYTKNAHTSPKPANRHGHKTQHDIHKRMCTADLSLQTEHKTQHDIHKRMCTADLSLQTET